MVQPHKTRKELNVPPAVRDKWDESPEAKDMMAAVLKKVNFDKVQCSSSRVQPSKPCTYNMLSCSGFLHTANRNHHQAGENGGIDCGRGLVFRGRNGVRTTLVEELASAFHV